MFLNAMNNIFVSVVVVTVVENARGMDGIIVWEKLMALAL